MKIIGIVAVKENSKRFPYKNFHKINGIELFMTNVNAIQKAGYKCYVTTNSELAVSICKENGIQTLWRGFNISDPEQPIFQVVKWAYQSIKFPADIIIIVLANTYQLNTEDIHKAVKLLKKYNLKEVRSVDINGVENGLLVLRSDYLLSKNEISTYTGSITTNAKEIHYKHDIEE